MNELLTPEALAVFLQVMGINLVLSGDNAIVIGLAASGLPEKQRNQVILFGMAAATILRIVFAVVAVQLLDVVGLLLAGGILLLWVCWKMWRDLRTSAHDKTNAEEALTGEDIDHDQKIAGGTVPQKTFAQAAWTIVVADVSMSLDNVLAVAGASHEYPVILIAGLVVSILVMGVAATVIARLLQRYHWLAYLGLAIIVFVSGEMIYHGTIDIFWPEHELADEAPGVPSGIPAPLEERGPEPVAPPSAMAPSTPAPAPTPTPIPAPTP